MPDVVFQEASSSSKLSWETKLGRDFVVLPSTAQSAPSATAQLIHIDDAASVWSQLPDWRTYSDCCRAPSPRSIGLC